MPDELEARLRRRFAACQEPLADVQFVAEVGARIRTAPRARPFPGTLRSVLRIVGGGLLTGLAAPLRLRHAGLMAAAAAAVTLWASLP